MQVEIIYALQEQMSRRFQMRKILKFTLVGTRKNLEKSEDDFEESHSFQYKKSTKKKERWEIDRRGF